MCVEGRVIAITRQAAMVVSKTDVEQKAVEKVESCRARLGYPFKVLGSYGASACCVGEC